MYRPSNKQIKESLKIAHERIKSWECEFICHSLQGTSAEEYLTYFINNAMGKEKSGWYNHATLNAWISERLGYWPNASDMRKYRLRWIEYMMEGL